MNAPRPLTRDWFERETRLVAQSLLGCLLVAESAAGRTVGRIVETEAYLGATDAASHAAMYKTERVAIMSAEAGFTYVYRSYGIHAMMNVVAKPPGEAGAVLVRALEPVEGIALMQIRRGLDDPRALCSGPGKLCQAMGITLADHGVDLTLGRRIWLEAGVGPVSMTQGPRIGITRAVDDPFRYWETGSSFVSAHRRGEQ